MRYYADTGFLLSLHLQETTSAAAAGAMQKVGEPLPVTPLVAVEFRNALRLAVFRGNISETDRMAAWTSFEQDLADGLLELTPTDSAAMYLEAQSLCERFTATSGVRTLDLLYVACGRILARTEFLSFD